MNKFRKWWYKNHPFKSKYKTIRVMWFVTMVIIGSILYIFASLLSSGYHFYEQMAEWFVEVRNVWPKLWK